MDIKKINPLLFIGAIFVLVVSGCNSNSSVGSDSKNLDDSISHTILDLEHLSYSDFDSTYRWSYLEQSEFEKLDSLLPLFVADTAGIFSSENVRHQSVELGKEKYFRQFVPALARNGEKEVWIYYSCGKPLPEWATQIRQVKDGGDCYFQLKINLANSTYCCFGVNGEG